MGGGAQADDGDAPVHGVHEVLEVGLRPLAEAGEDDDGVGLVQFCGVRKRLLVVGVNRFAAVGGEGEEHGAGEAVALAEDFPQHGQALFAAVFLVSADEDDGFSLAGAVFPFVGDVAGGPGPGGGKRGEREREQF